LGSLYYWEDLTRAQRVTEESLTEARAIGSKMVAFLALLQLVFVSCLQNDLTKAKGYCFDVLAVAQTYGVALGIGLALFGVGLTATFGGELEKGARLFAAVDTMFRQSGLKWFSSISGSDPFIMVFKQALEKIQAQLGPAAFEAAWAQGQQMTMEQAIKLATEDEDRDSAHPD
jgi:hypothetical protein